MAAKRRGSWAFALALAAVAVVPVAALLVAAATLTPAAPNYRLEIRSPLR